MLKACMYPARHLMFMSNDNSNLLSFDNLHVNHLHYKSRSGVDDEFDDIEKQIQINIRLSFKKPEPVEIPKTNVELEINTPAQDIKIDSRILKRKILPDCIEGGQEKFKIRAVLNRIISNELFLFNFNKRFNYEIDAVLEVKNTSQMIKIKNKIGDDDDVIHKKLKNNHGLAYGRKFLTAN